MSAASMRHWKRGRGYHVWQDPAPLYARGLSSEADEEQEQREKNAQLRIVHNRRHSQADPGLSETVNPKSAQMYWLGFFSCAALTAGVWALSVLTTAINGGAL